MDDSHSTPQPISHPIALKAFDRIADRWRLSTEERCKILSVERGTYEAWISEKGAPTLSDPQIITISKVINIYDGLHRLFGDESYADRWIRCENAAFDNQQPLNVMLNQDTAGMDGVFELIMDALRI